MVVDDPTDEKGSAAVSTAAMLRDVVLRADPSAGVIVVSAGTEWASNTTRPRSDWLGSQW